MSAAHRTRPIEPSHACVRPALNAQLQAEKRLTGVTERAARLAGALSELSHALCHEFGHNAEKPVDPEAEIPLFGSPKPKCSATVQVPQHERDYWLV